MGSSRSRVVPSSGWASWCQAARACKRHAKHGIMHSHAFPFSFSCVFACACVDSAALPLPEPPTSPPQSAADVEHAITGIGIVRSTVLREVVGELTRRINMASARHVALSLLDALGVDRRPYEDCERVDDILVAALVRVFTMRPPLSGADPSASRIHEVPCDPNDGKIDPR